MTSVLVLKIVGGMVLTGVGLAVISVGFLFVYTILFEQWWKIQFKNDMKLIKAFHEFSYHRERVTPYFKVNNELGEIRLLLGESYRSKSLLDKAVKVTVTSDQYNKVLEKHKEFLAQDSREDAWID